MTKKWYQTPPTQQEIMKEIFKVEMLNHKIKTEKELFIQKMEHTNIYGACNNL